jgi:hypothetical protein
MGMPPQFGGRHWIRSAEEETAALEARASRRLVVDGAAIAGFAYPAQSDVTDDTAPIPVVIPGPRPCVDSATVRIEAGTQRLERFRERIDDLGERVNDKARDQIVDALVQQDPPDADPRIELESATSLIGVITGKPVFVDESGRRKRLLAMAGATVVTVCAAYVAVVGVSVLHGTDIGPVGTALAGLLPPTVDAQTPPDDGDDTDTTTGNALPAVAAASTAPKVAVAPAAEQLAPTSSVQVAAPPTTTTRKQTTTTERAATTTTSRASRTRSTAPDTSTAATQTTDSSAPATDTGTGTETRTAGN